MVSPDHNDGIFGEAQSGQLGHDFADLGIGVGDAGGVVLSDFEGKGGVVIGVFAPAIVFHKFTGAVPGGFSGGFGGLGSGGELSVFVEFHVFGGGTEGEVGAEDAGGHEEGF